jgi:hypothetical protein
METKAFKQNRVSNQHPLRHQKLARHSLMTLQALQPLQKDEVRFQSSRLIDRASGQSAQLGVKKWLLGLSLLPSLLITGLMPGLAFAQSPSASSHSRLSLHAPVLVEHARKSDVIPGVQQQVHQTLGLTGKGVRVHLIDQFFVQEKLNSFPGLSEMTHGHDMNTLIRTVAPDASFTASDMKDFLRRDASVFPDVFALKLKDDMKTLDEYIVKQSARQLDLMSAEFEALAKLPDAQRPHLVNMSMALNLKSLMEHLQEDLYQVVESGGQLVLPYPNYRKIVLGNDADSPDRDVRLQRIGLHLEVLMNQDAKTKGPFSEALTRYESACKSLREKGTLIIVAVGNDGDSYPNLVFTDRGPTKFRQNVLSMNPYVLAVGALDNRQTPNDTKDDQASTQNSPGPVGFLMSGTQVMINRPALGEDVMAGSSCSTALTSGMAALLVQKMHLQGKPLSAEALQCAIVKSGETISVAPHRLVLDASAPQAIPAYSPSHLLSQLK